MLWKDIGIATSIIAAFGVVFGFNNTRINKKQDKTMCSTLHENVEKELERGSKQFDKINNTLDAHGEILSNLDKNVAVLASKVCNE